LVLYEACRANFFKLFLIEMLVNLFRKEPTTKSQNLINQNNVRYTSLIDGHNTNTNKSNQNFNNIRPTSAVTINNNDIIQRNFTTTHLNQPKKEEKSRERPNYDTYNHSSNNFFDRKQSANSLSGKGFNNYYSNLPLTQSKYKSNYSELANTFSNMDYDADRLTIEKGRLSRPATSEMKHLNNRSAASGINEIINNINTPKRVVVDNYTNKRDLAYEEYQTPYKSLAIASKSVDRPKYKENTNYNSLSNIRSQNNAFSVDRYSMGNNPDNSSLIYGSNSIQISNTKSSSNIKPSGPYNNYNPSLKEKSREYDRGVDYGFNQINNSQSMRERFYPSGNNLLFKGNL